LGVDNCLIGNNSCSPQPNIGAANWNCAAYWAGAHPGIALKPPGCDAGTTSRFDVYTYELANAARLSDLSGGASGTGETGAPQCSAATAKAGRRIMNVAIVNCKSSPVTIQSNAQNVPVAGFGQFFLTHPTTNQTKPYAEFRGLIDRGAGTVKDQVQLYR
jgi:hypothetical protein